MSYDKLAQRYLDKAFPQTRQVTGHDLERLGIDPALHDEARQIMEQFKQQQGVMPTADQVVVEFRRRQSAARRRGI